MSTMKKRIPMFLLALAMMVAMAAPTFADGFHPAGCDNLYLNITRSSTSQSVPASSLLVRDGLQAQHRPQ